MFPIATDVCSVVHTPAYSLVVAELEPVTKLMLPGRFALKRNLTPETEAGELDNLARLVVEGTRAIGGIYMRICDVIRSGTLPEVKIVSILERHFPQPRISEILRVARAPDEVYSRYTAGFFGFKAALKSCRLYNITPSEELNRRKIKRAAERLVFLLNGSGEVRVNGRRIVVQPTYENPNETSP